MNRTIEIREAEPGGPIELSGHAATFGEPYPVGSFTETIAPGAFKRTLKENPDVSLLVNHTGTPLARTTSGTMTLSEDARGLHVHAELEPSDPDVQALVPKVRRGDLSEMSFAFRANKQSWSDDKTERTLHEVVIHRGDVSLVTTAANPSATASLRAEALTLEQRERLAERIGNGVCGPYSAPDPVPVSTTPPRRGPSSQTTIARSHVELAKAKRAKGSSGHVKRRPPRTTNRARSDLELAKARRAAMPSHPHVARRYSFAEIQALGKEGLAHKRKDGKFNYPIVDGTDLLNAIYAIGRTDPGERMSVKRWIVYRAKLLGMKGEVPRDWIGGIGSRKWAKR